MNGDVMVLNILSPFPNKFIEEWQYIASSPPNIISILDWTSTKYFGTGYWNIEYKLTIESKQHEYANIHKLN